MYALVHRIDVYIYWAEIPTESLIQHVTSALYFLPFGVTENPVSQWWTFHLKRKLCSVYFFFCANLYDFLSWESLCWPERHSLEAIRVNLANYSLGGLALVTRSENESEKDTTDGKSTDPAVDAQLKWGTFTSEWGYVCFPAENRVRQLYV